MRAGAPGYTTLSRSPIDRTTRMTTHVSLAPDAGRRALTARLSGDDADTARARAGLSPAGYRQAVGGELGRLAVELDARRSGADRPHDRATLVRYVAGLATAQSDPGLEAHVEACASCGSFVEDLRARAWARVAELEAAAASPAAVRAPTDPVLGVFGDDGAPGALPPVRATAPAPAVRVVRSAPTAADLTLPDAPTPWWRRRGAMVGGAVALAVLAGGGTALALTSGGGGERGPTPQQLAARRAAAAAQREDAARGAAIAALGARSSAQQTVLERQARQRAAARKRREAAQRRREARERREAARKRREARERRAAAAAAPAPAPARASAPAPAVATPAPAPAPAPRRSSGGGSRSSGPMSQSGGGWG